MEPLNQEKVLHIQEGINFYPCEAQPCTSEKLFA